MYKTVQDELLESRTTGILFPLFSMKSDKDWGVGDFTTLKEWISFFAALGVKIVQILPITEMAYNQNCPYSSLSAFAIDPAYIDVTQVEEVKKCPEAQEYIQSIAGDIDFWNAAKRANLRESKQAKLKVLWLGYQHFLQNDFIWSSPRAEAFIQYRNEQQHWLRNYSVFRTLKEHFTWAGWQQWPAELANFQKEAVDAFELEHKEQVNFFSYVQWVAALQMKETKAFARAQGVDLFGDIPFSTNLDAAEVWSERENFMLDRAIGAPPDQFSLTGQSWGLPAYDFEYMRESGYSLWRRKIERATELYDVFRLDHLVGFYRSYIFPPGETIGYFDITDEQAQIDRGYHFLRMVLDAGRGCLPVGEDLGLIPNYVRRMLVDLRIPGYKVLRWEREDNGYYREPRDYPAVSLATTSTHDTESLRGWWESMDAHERANVWEMISSQKTDGNIPFTPDTQHTILWRVLTSGSALTLFSWQDIIGTLDRVNVPGTVCEENWSYRFEFTPAETSIRYALEMENFKTLLKETGRSTLV